MLESIMPEDGSVSQSDNYHDLEYGCMSQLQSARCQREGDYAKDKADELWQSVSAGKYNLEQALTELKQYCKDENYHSQARGLGVRRLKELAEKEDKVKAKAKQAEKRDAASQSQGIVEDQDIEQFRKSLELRASAVLILVTSAPSCINFGTSGKPEGISLSLGKSFSL